MKLTETTIRKLPQTERGKQKIYYDDNLKGFGVRVTEQGKVFIAEGRINGKTVRRKIGLYPNLSPDMARIEAKKVFGQAAQGINLNEKDKEEKVKRITLQQAYEDYLKARKDLKPSTKRDYKSIMKVCFGDWKDRALIDINKDLVEKKHRLIGTKVNKKGGPARANTAMKVLRAIFEFSRDKYEDANGDPFIQENPVRRLTRSKAWYRVERRRTFIKRDEIKAWWDATQGLKNDKYSNKGEMVKDYLILLILTGLRRNEGAKLKWSDVDLKNKTMTLRDTKNRNDLILPITDFVGEMLFKRKEGAISEYVFSSVGKKGFLQEPKRQMAKVTEASKLDFILHDLRRTYATIAEGLDIGHVSLKRLLNHSVGDITERYIQTDVERLRGPAQKIENEIIRLANNPPEL